MLNKIWAGFFFAALLAAVVQAVFLGNPGVFADMVGATFDLAKTAFEIALGLTGVMCLWLGFMRLGETGGAVEGLTRLFGPLFRRLFPSVPRGHAAESAVTRRSIRVFMPRGSVRTSDPMNMPSGLSSCR